MFKRKGIFVITAILILAGCRPDVDEAGKNRIISQFNEVDDEQQIDHSHDVALALQVEDLQEIQASLTYTGELESIEITHADPVIGFVVYQDDTIAAESGTDTVMKQSTLLQEEPVGIEMQVIDGEGQPLILEAGEYVVKAIALFSLLGIEEEIRLEKSVSFTVE